jgi:preprotein translocase SecF subunit
LIALVHDLSFVVIGCFIAGIHYSLAVLAGILTTIGYSVMDSLVLWTNIQSRAQILLKEDYSPKDIVTSSIDNILSRDVLTSMCTMIPSIVILGLGISPLRDFAWTMLIGTVAGTLSSIFIIGACAERTLAMTVFSRDSAPRPATVRVTANERLSKQQIFERMHSHD